MYHIIIENRAKKEIRALSPENVRRVTKAISHLKKSPRPNGVKKLVDKIGWRITVGNYRILYDISDNEKNVSIYRVKHRREVYR